MAIKALNPQETQEYVSRKDEFYRENVKDAKEAGATVFVLRTLSAAAMSRINDSSRYVEYDIGTDTQKFFQTDSYQALVAFRYGVQDILNLQDGEGNVIPVTRHKVTEGNVVLDVLSEDIINRIPNSVISEVGKEIIKRNSLTASEAKNFEALLSQFAGSKSTTAEPAQNNSAEAGDAKKK